MIGCSSIGILQHISRQTLHTSAHLAKSPASRCLTSSSLRAKPAQLSGQVDMAPSAPQQTSSPIPPPPASRSLSAKEGPLVWIDCEMTGLDIKVERLLEVACIITDGNLEPIDEGVSYVIKTEREVLDQMGDWCTQQHGKSGLTAACQDASIARHHADVRAAVLAYVRDRVPNAGVACLAGNSVHADAMFLKKEMPELTNHLHYRIVDVSSIKELVARWYGDGSKWSAGKGAHRALDDIKGSIAELKHYRSNVFLNQGKSA